MWFSGLLWMFLHVFVDNGNICIIQPHIYWTTTTAATTTITIICEEQKKYIWNEREKIEENINRCHVSMVKHKQKLQKNNEIKKKKT